MLGGTCALGFFFIALQTLGLFWYLRSCAGWGGEGFGRRSKKPTITPLGDIFDEDAGCSSNKTPVAVAILASMYLQYALQSIAW